MSAPILRIVVYSSIAVLAFVDAKRIGEVGSVITSEANAAAAAYMSAIIVLGTVILAIAFRMLKDYFTNDYSLDTYFMYLFLLVIVAFNTMALPYASIAGADIVTIAKHVTCINGLTLLPVIVEALIMIIYEALGLVEKKRASRYGHTAP